jgi:hypothetical protein
MGHRIVEPLGKRGPLERQATHTARHEQVLDSARRVELAYSKGEGLLVGSSERHSGSIRPAGALLTDRLMKKPGQTLLARHLYE